MKAVPFVGHVVRTACVCLLLAVPGEAAEWFVAPAGTGTGTKTDPLGRIQDALNIAQPGDTITLRAGTYSESVHSVRHGTPQSPIRLRAVGERGSVLVTAPGRVLTVDHAYFTVEGLVIDGQYGMSDTIRTSTGAGFLTIRNTEVRRSTQDLIDITGSPTGVLIENCLIHHALNAANGRTDAHGIAAGAVRNLTVRNTEIHTFSGDALQVDPGRAAPGWTGVTLDNVRMWLAPLPAAENGFPAGTVAGENAIDTKANASLARATLTIRNSTAWGFRNGLIGNMAAFNLKENIDATLDGVTVFDSEIAFRLRGGGTSGTGAWVTLKNTVVHDVLTAYRYEDNIESLHIWNGTIGQRVMRSFQAASSTRTGLDVRNLLILGSRPVEAADRSNLAVSALAFVDAAQHNYRLAPSTPAIDAGTTIAGVSTDRDGVRRPVGIGYDVGAYEWRPPDPGEVGVHAWTAPVVAGAWKVIPDAPPAERSHQSLRTARAVIHSVHRRARAPARSNRARRTASSAAAGETEARRQNESETIPDRRRTRPRTEARTFRRLTLQGRASGHVLEPPAAR